MQLDVFALYGLSLVAGLSYFWGKDGQIGFPGIAPLWLYRDAEAAGPVVCILAAALGITLHYARWKRRRDGA